MSLGDFFGSQGFDHTTVEPASSNSVIPAGDYLLFSKKAVMKQTNKADGHYLEIEFDVVEGKYKGRKLWARMNIDNRSEKAVGIARAELSALCGAAKIRPLANESQLVGISVIGHVKIDKNGSNVIRSYSNPSSAREQSAVPQAPPAAPPQAPTVQPPAQPAQAAVPGAQIPQSSNPAAPAARPWEQPKSGDDIPF